MYAHLAVVLSLMFGSDPESGMVCAAGILAAGEQAGQLQQRLSHQSLGFEYAALLADAGGVQGGGLDPGSGPLPETPGHRLCRYGLAGV